MDLKDLKGSDELDELVAKAYEWAERVRLNNIERVKLGLLPSTNLDKLPILKVRPRRKDK